MALVTMKFLLDLRPSTGFSWALGTGTFLCVQSYEKFLTAIVWKIPGGSVSLPMVPVFFFKKLLGCGFLSPIRWPKVLV